MSWKKVCVKDISKQLRGVSYAKDQSSQQFLDGYVPLLRAHNIKDGRINFDDLVYVPKEFVSDNQYLLPNDIVIAASSGSINLVGKAGQFHNENKALSFGAFCKVLRPDTNKVHPKFFNYFFQTDSYKRKILNSAAGANINNIRNEHLDNLEFPLPPQEIQVQIASALAEADTLIQKRKEAIAKLDELVQSIFYEMFGDLVRNSKNWTITGLESIADLSSGVTKGKKYKDPKLLSVPYMRVANVQDRYIDLTDIKEIMVSTTDAERYRLYDRDVLLTEGGDPDKLGRGAVWKAEIENCIHQNHIFRVRVKTDVLNPYFLAACTGSNYGKKYFLKMAKQTTGIATINMTQLKSFPVPLPPLQLQNKFEQLLQEIERQKKYMEQQLTKQEENFQSILHQAFTGQLQFSEAKVNDYAIKC